MTTQIDGTKGVVYPDGFYQSNANSGEGALTQFYLPAAGSAYQDCYRAGFLPSWFNQQWGGAQWGTLPDGSFGSVATGQIQVDGSTAAFFGYDTTTQAISIGFVLPEAMTSPTIWVKIYKVGNPTNNITAGIWSNTTGRPNALIGSTGTLAGQVVTSKTDGEWYAITPASGALSANTQYHLVLNASTNSTTNYYGAKYTASNKYPHGYYNAITSAPAYTPTTTIAIAFLIQNPAANSIIQSGGMFDYKLAFNPGTPVNQSRSVAQPLANFYDGKTCSVLYRGTFAVSSNVWDFTYGLDHDRITLTINASGFPVLTIYESDRTVATVTGTGSVTSGNHDVGIKVRTVGDSSDYATLYVDGVSVGTPLTAQTFTMDVNMVTLGTARLGDGFGLAPTWTQDMQMTSLPSAQGWTWTGTATEANAMSVSGGKLYQNANGYTSTQTGYYAKTVVMVNATGWAVDFGVRVSSDGNTDASNPVEVYVNDGTYYLLLWIHEYFLQVYSNGAVIFTVQGDFKSSINDFVLNGKGTDFYLHCNGRLLIDGTGKMTGASATNSIFFGDRDAVAGRNSDAIWSYVKYYQGGMILPTANTGTCSEFAHWSGDKSALYASLWNSGTPVSVKQLCGVPRNYQFEQVVQREVRRGVAGQQTTTATTMPALLADMESYVVGADLVIDSSVCVLSATSGTTIGSSVYVNGVQAVAYSDTYGNSIGTVTAVNAEIVLPQKQLAKNSLGLNKIEQRWRVNANTGIADLNRRTLTVEASS